MPPPSERDNLHVSLRFECNIKIQMRMKFFLIVSSGIETLLSGVRGNNEDDSSQCLRECGDSKYLNYILLYVALGWTLCMNREFTESRVIRTPHLFNVYT